MTVASVPWESRRGLKYRYGLDLLVTSSGANRARNNLIDSACLSLIISELLPPTPSRARRRWRVRLEPDPTSVRDSPLPIPFIHLQ